MEQELIKCIIHNLEKVNQTILLPTHIAINIPNAKSEVMECMKVFVENVVWLPEYDNVVSWLEDNHGKGLLCIGNCGRGKTMMCYRVIPVLINHFMQRIVNCYNAVDINDNIDDIKHKTLICIDDIGTEGNYMKYGVRREPFGELIDAAEKEGKLLLLTTNCTIDELTNRYGIRVVDRLKRITRVIHFIGGSLR